MTERHFFGCSIIVQGLIAALIQYEDSAVKLWGPIYIAIGFSARYIAAVLDEKTGS